jgi:hypothetical protein
VDTYFDKLVVDQEHEDFYKMAAVKDFGYNNNIELEESAIFFARYFRADEVKDSAKQKSGDSSDQSTLDSLKEKASDAFETVKEKASDAYEAVKQKVSGPSDSDESQSHVPKSGQNQMKK